MSSLENLISEARLLGNRLRENEAFADALIGQASNIQERLTAMKQVMKMRNPLGWSMCSASNLLELMAPSYRNAPSSPRRGDEFVSGRH